MSIKDNHSRWVTFDTGDELGDEIDKLMVMIGKLEEEILEVMQGGIKIMKDKTVEENTEVTTEMKVTAEVEIGTGLERGHFLETLVMIEIIGVRAIVGPDQD